MIVFDCPLLEVVGGGGGGRGGRRPGFPLVMVMRIVIVVSGGRGKGRRREGRGGWIRESQLRKGIPRGS